MTQPPVFDIHTHRPDAGPRALISVAPGAAHQPDCYYSVGIHPWNAEQADAAALALLEHEAQLQEVLAIGESGLDGRRGPDIELQERLFRHHAELAERMGKPLIIHAVASFPKIIALKRELRPEQPWIIHGFRGKPELAAELVRHCFYLSLGEKFNPASLAQIPSKRLLVETDESTVPIADIATRMPGLDTGLPYQLLKISTDC